MAFQNDKEKSYLPILGSNPANRGIGTYLIRAHREKNFPLYVEALDALTFMFFLQLITTIIVDGM